MTNKKFLEYITVHQKDIVIMLSAIILTFLVFLFFIYSPKKRQMKAIEIKFKDVEKEIEKIESIAGGADKIDVSLSEFNRQLKDIDKKLPKSEETAIKELSAFASKSGIEVISIKQQNIKKGSVQPETADFQYMELPITMDVKCAYRNLGEYLRILQEEFPTLVLIKHVSILKAKPNEETSPGLTARLLVFICMSKPQER